MNKRALHIFRRDLRLQDNTALNQAATQHKEVLACFIFDPRQVEKHEYRSTNALQFMIESLQELSQEIKDAGGALNIFKGKPEEIVKQLIRKHGIDAIYLNADYTPFSKQRDEAIKEICEKAGIPFHACHDALLAEPGTIRTQQGEPYKVYTPFSKQVRARSIPRPYTEEVTFVKKQYGDESLLKEYAPETNPDIFCKGGRSKALEILKNIKEYDNYKEERDYPAQDGTTGLSAHNKFGTVSIREVWHTIATELGNNSTLLSELIWRDFYTHVAHDYPHVFGKAFQEKYQRLEWEERPEKLQAWKEGKTGFPIVDAGMRQLKATGWMHNRVRMIAASFLTKDLRVDWQEGEKHFAQQLIDYDPCVNNGSWQWAASTGTDAQPYFRIFNPWTQQKRYDSDATYIKEWVPELRGLDAKHIHKLDEEPIDGYPKPIVNHSEERTKTLAWFKSQA